MARALGIPFIDLDQYIEAQAGRTIRQIFAERGEDGFRQLERERLHEVGEQEGECVVACGGGTPCFFDNMAYMNRRGQTLLLDAPLDVLFRRLKHGTRKRPVLRDKTDDDLRQFIAHNLESRRPYYSQAQYVIDSSCLETRMQLASTVDEVRRILGLTHHHSASMS